MSATRERIWYILEGSATHDLLTRIASTSLVVLILLNMAAVATGTLPHLPVFYHRLLWRFEIFSVEFQQC